VQPMRPHLVILLAVSLGCRAAPAPWVWPFADRVVVAEAPAAMVVTAHPLASDVGREVLRRGGNAVDAAVAVGLALQVVHPAAGNIGGGGFMVYRAPDGAVRTLDYRETAPAAATPGMYLDADGNPTDRSVTGHLAAGVPGSVAGLFEAHRALGRLPWAELVEPAIRLARDGFTVDEHRERSIRADSARLSRFPASAAQYLPGGRPPPAGTRWRQPDLARTLEHIRDRGADGFYRGPVADLVVAEMARGGGIITHGDLEGYRPLWRDPVRISYRGHTIYTMAPVSSGGVTLAIMLNIMERYDRLPAFGSADLLHLQAEAMRRAFLDRNRWLGDPAFVEMPLERLLSKTYAADLQREIHPRRATPTPALQVGVEPEQTTHYSVVDADGGAVSVTTTLNNSYGSAVTVTGAGFLLNDEMDDFVTAPGRPNMYGLVEGDQNAIAPGKRMLSSMTPTIALDPEGGLWLVAGTPGGPTIITQVFHVLTNLIDHGMSLADALTAPRMHHQAIPDSIQLERDAFPVPVHRELERRGHHVRLRAPMGDVAAIIRTTTGWQGVSDPRRGGAAAGY
jgi:gamma-glutamyltranspeptidase/glutathione hydrolase